MESTQKPHNIARDLNDLLHVSRILQCGRQACNRTIVEYGLDEPETRHSRSLPAQTLAMAMSMGVELVNYQCDHHGGLPYAPITPLPHEV